MPGLLSGLNPDFFHDIPLSGVYSENVELSRARCCIRSELDTRVKTSLQETERRQINKGDHTPRHFEGAPSSAPHKSSEPNTLKIIPIDVQLSSLVFTRPFSLLQR